MAAPLVLDTNALLARGFLRWLRGYPGAKLLPAVAFVELGVHWVPQRSMDGYEATLRAAGVEVEWLTTDHARLAVELALAQGRFAERARDFLIGAHAASPPRVLVTNDLGDFGFLGRRARTPAQVMAAPPR